VKSKNFLVRFKVFTEVTILIIWVVGLRVLSIFSPEDGENMLLRNVGFYQPVHKAP
jgi:hypothetical protein